MLGNEGMIQRRQPMHSAGFRDTGGMIRRHHYFEFQVNNTQTIGGLFSTIAGKTISVDWGDGSARSTYSGTDQAWSKDYGSAGDRTVRIFGAVVLTKFRMDAAGADISFDIANLPAGVAHLSVTGSNTVSGNIANASTGLIYLSIAGNNTITGDVINISTNIRTIQIWGLNTITGNIANVPYGVMRFNIFGLNTLFGNIGNFVDGLAEIQVTGLNIISNYTSKLWTTKPATFIIIPVAPGGLSTAEIDQLLIDLDEDLVWTAGNVIELTGTNAARSAASDAAVTNMTNEGATITTN